MSIGLIFGLSGLLVIIAIIFACVSDSDPEADKHWEEIKNQSHQHYLESKSSVKDHKANQKQPYANTRRLS
jgi:hypothetical protein